MVKIDTLFQTEKCEMRLTFELEMVCLSKHAAWRTGTATMFVYSAILTAKWSPLPCSRVGMAKSIPCSREKC